MVGEDGDVIIFQSKKLGFGVFQTLSGLWGQDLGPVGTADMTLYMIICTRDRG